MKKLVRIGVFEVNSSSSHSVSVASDSMEFVKDIIYPDQFGNITLTGGEFGWEYFKFNDAINKANYVAQVFNNNHHLLGILKEVIIEQTGASDVIFDNLDNGYVDHESYGILGLGSEWLKNFIFNKNSWIFGGNDNSSPDPTFYHVPVFCEGKMILPVYKYELIIEGFSKTTKFLDFPTDEELSDGIDSLIDSTLLSKTGYFVDNGDIGFQITRSRDYYEKSWNVSQDYSKRTILFIKEGSYNLIDKIEKEIVKKTENKKSRLDYETKRKLITKECLKVPDLIKKIKFTLKEI